MSSNGSGFNSCSGDTVSLVWSPANNTVASVFQSNPLFSGTCFPSLAASFVDVNNCLVSRGFRIVVAVPNGSVVNLLYVRC
jgi:hypothetical protein